MYILLNSSRMVILALIKKNPFLNKWYIKRLQKKGVIIPLCDIDIFLNEANEVIIQKPLENFKVGLVRQQEDYISENYFTKRAYWPQYERFLKNNKISYTYYDIHSSRWMVDSKEFDIILWHPYYTPDIHEEAKTKIYFLEKYLGKRCFPSFDELWSYEDKVKNHYILEHFNFPCVPTFVTNSKKEAIEFINNTDFPIISKIANGSSSKGVHRISNKKEAINYINSCFSDIGLKTYWPFMRQKNYVYFQKYITDSEFDLRIILVGSKIFGYYRYPKPGDFRASGAGIIEMRELPEIAMKTALSVKDKLKVSINPPLLAIDMVYSTKLNVYYIIETSIFCGVDTPDQLVINGISGYYEYIDDKFLFKEGRYWIQELALELFFSSL